ncbi:MAG: site-2 protease family protein [Pseudomonadota bacterium]|nr:site-2 protease family protein [Pseudomonadota bacterium]
MPDILITIAILVPSLVIAIVFHEVAHGYAAKALGDPTASDRGRLTLNPIKHVSPVGTLMVPGFLALVGGPVFGWAKPVPVNQRRLSNPRYGMMAVAAAGPLSNFVLAGLGAIGLGLSWSAGAQVDFASSSLLFVLDAQGQPLALASGLYVFILINLFLGLFNLLPIPPFDGSHIVGGLLPDRLRVHWQRIQQLGMVLILGVVAFSWVFGTGWLATVIGAPLQWALDHYLALASFISGL